MFEKPLTPSDVGKLNRLVIPKQHAEKYFPLGGDSGEKGLLLSFEDESGKTWQFRYSYWNSSQSYVLTKGWSRFVKEKRLDAGDVVLFERPRLGGDRLYIGCRHRGGNDSPSPAQATTVPAAAGPWSPGYYAATCSYPTSSSCFSSAKQDCLLHAGDQRNGAIQSETEAPTTSKRLRLFGVDLDYQPEPRPDPMPSISWV
ncbi:hypothetical protein BHE74_00041947 [Ensete ventricosum]|nr:hypothetical protein GW17_00018869 [Ensete ventricosum]RWW51676.1 hypothetical protein BHE74_00041947 [Ensete ventricosum]RZR88681.1 hypothetical protein BHM03_00016307 [Ensete ventricosum]